MSSHLPVKKQLGLSIDDAPAQKLKKLAEKFPVT